MINRILPKLFTIPLLMMSVSIAAEVPAETEQKITKLSKARDMLTEVKATEIYSADDLVNMDPEVKTKVFTKVEAQYIARMMRVSEILNPSSGSFEDHEKKMASDPEVKTVYEIIKNDKTPGGVTPPLEKLAFELVKDYPTALAQLNEMHSKMEKKRDEWRNLMDMTPYSFYLYIGALNCKSEAKVEKYKKIIAESEGEGDLK